MPYGGVRGDVGGAFPDIAGSNESGFSMAYSYSSLSSGDHSAKAIAYDTLGNSKESVSTDFSVVKLAEDFIGDPDAVKLDAASCSLERDEITLVDALITDEPVDLLLKWRTAEQGFEIIEVRGGGSAVAMLRSRHALPVSAKPATAETSDSVFRAVLEEPVQDEIHSGVGNSGVGLLHLTVLRRLRYLSMVNTSSMRRAGLVRMSQGHSPTCQGQTSRDSLWHLTITTCRLAGM